MRLTQLAMLFCNVRWRAEARVWQYRSELTVTLTCTTVSKMIATRNVFSIDVLD